MTDDAFGSVLVPILKELRGFLGHLVVIGGWVPELHRRFGSSDEWAVKPLGTTEVDMLVGGAGPEGNTHQELAEALVGAGFAPVGTEGASAVWERDAGVGERVEFFVDHAGPWQNLSTVHTLDTDARLGGLLLSDLGILEEESVTFSVPLGEIEGTQAVALVRVPELGAFLIHKGATFRRRPDVAKSVKDLHYIVDVMQSGETRVQKVETEIQAYCGEGGEAAEIARQARDHLSVVINEPAGTELRQRLAEGLSMRHNISEGEADARAMGFLADFLGLIPEECGGVG